LKIKIFAPRCGRVIRGAGMSAIATPFSTKRPGRSTTTHPQADRRLSRLKVLFALEDELASAPEAPRAEAMWAAVYRHLHSPMKCHHGLRFATQALDFLAREA